MAKNTAVIEKEPMHVELAEWFLRSGEELRTSEDIVDKMCQIKERHNLQVKDIIRKEYSGFIMQVRMYLETKYKLTLVGVKVPNERYFAYKIANDQEATIYGVKHVKRLILQADRVERLVPLIKKQYVWPSVRKVFGTAEEAIAKFHRIGERFKIAYDTDYKAVKQIEREQSQPEQNNGKRVLNDK